MSAEGRELGAIVAADVVGYTAADEQITQPFEHVVSSLDYEDSFQATHGYDSLTKTGSD